MYKTYVTCIMYDVWLTGFVRALFTKRMKSNDEDNPPGSAYNLHPHTV